jgi:hypothetical protein
MTTRNNVFCTFFLLTAYATVQHYFTVNMSLSLMGTWSYKATDYSGDNLELTPDSSTSCDDFNYENVQDYPDEIRGYFSNATKFNAAKNNVFALLRAERQMSAQVFFCIASFLAMSLCLLYQEREWRAEKLYGWYGVLSPAVYFMRCFNIERPLTHELCKMMLYNTDSTKYLGYDPLDEFLQTITNKGVGFSHYMHRLPQSDGSNSMGFILIIMCFLIFIHGLSGLQPTTTIRDGGDLSNFYKTVRGFPLCIALEILLSALSYLARGSASLLQRGFNYVHEAGCIKNHSLFSGDNFACEEINYEEVNSQDHYERTGDIEPLGV